jgi:acyl-CoA synthetase
MPLSMMVRERATYDPDGAAYLAAGGTYSWSWYDETADRLAAELAVLARVPGSGMGPRARVAVWLPDSPRLHAVYLACERAGLVVVGVPSRAGDLELAHLLRQTGASLLICPPAHRERTAAAIVAGLRGDGLRGEKANQPSPRPVPLALHAELSSGGTLRVFHWGSGDAGDAGGTPAPVDVSGARREHDAGLGVDDLWLLNSTSGTTGLSDCAEQTQRTWLSLAEHAIGAAAITENDVIMSAVPSPSGYGLWTAHLLPALLGVPCVLRERFDPDRAVRAAAGHRGTLPGHRVTVLACVTTQLRLMLASPLMDQADWSALRVTFTGGERTPPEVIAEWERRTGSTVLHFSE